MAGATTLFAPYLPALLPEWAAAEPGLALRTVPGSLVHFDISGFTRLTERLASHGRAGAEELSDILDLVFGPLVDVAVSEGCDLLKWGGDAVLLFAPGDDGPVRAARAAFRMRTVLRKVGHLRTTVGPVVLRASSAVVTGEVVLVLGGDERLHRELIVLGPSATAAADLEGAASAGQVLLDDLTARRLEARLVGGEHGGGRLLTGLPRAPDTRPPVTGEPVADALEHLLPPQLRSHLLQGAHEPEHRVATAAFVRFSGTDVLLSERGPASLAAAVDELVRNIQDATWHHGVSFHESDIDVDGGKVMLVAGAPLSSGDDVDHMLATVRLIVDRAGEIPIRVGVAQGRVFAGDLGPHVRRAYSVKGGAVNLAARLAARAGNGEILVPAELLSHSRSQWEVLARSAQRLKGIADPVPTVSLGSAGVEVRAASDDTVMVGRGLELGRLRSALDRLGTGGSGLFEIVGEPGMGKTRLVSELVSEADDFRVLKAECAHSGAAAPYATVRTLLTDALGLHGAVDPDLALRQVREVVGADAPELVDRLGMLGAVFDVRLVGTTPEVSSLGEEFRTDALHRLVVEVLRAVLITPTVLVVEDTQLMDRDSSGVMTQLVARASDRPWLVVTTRRSGAESWSPAGAELLTLGPLDAGESQSLAEVVSPDHPLTPAAAASLAERAGGHPLFLRELVLAAVRGESLDGLPLNVEELVAVQIDALAPRPRAVLRRAAVVGATFTESLLLEVLVDEGGGQSAGTVPGELRALTAYLAPDGANSWRFRHTVHREAAYAGLSVKVRSRLHARVGDALARSSRSGRRPEVLAHHYLAAGRFDDAWTFARQAGANAMERAAPEAAAQAYGQAAEAAARSLSVGPQERAQDLESWGDALFLCGRSAESDLAYTKARRLCLDRPLASAGLDLKLAKVAQRQGRYPVALRRTSHGLGMIAPVEGPEALAARARLLARRSFILMSLGRYAEAGSHALDAIGVAERAHEDDALARAHLVLQGVEVFTGASSGDDHGAQALAIYERLGDLSGQAHAHNNVAMRLMLTGDWPAALERFQLSAASFEEVGDVANAANAAYNSADLLNRQGRSAEALAVLGTASRVARAVGDEELAALVLREEGRARVRSGARDFGMSLLAEARAQFQALHEPHEVCETDIALAEAYLLSGRPTEAKELAEAALGSAQRLGAATLLPSALRVLACAHMELGDLDVARALLEDGLRVSAEPEVAHERGFLLAVAARLRAGDDQARDAAQAALAGLGVVSPPLPWASEPARK